MRFGIVLPSYIWGEDRRRWAEASMASLARTVTEGVDTPYLLGIGKGNAAMNLLTRAKLPQFEVKVVGQPSDVKSNDGCLAWGLDQLSKTPGITHGLMLADDWIYNPRWLLELRDLIGRRPGARAWWVYRSAYEEIHKTLRVDGDVLVRSINGGGCITVEEWRGWGWDYHKVPRENGNLGNISLDLLHPQERPGERWVTARSYVLNIGMRGSCQRPDTPDFAVDFVGTDEVVPVPAVVATRPPTTPERGKEPFSVTLELPDGYRLTVRLERGSTQ